MQQSVFDDLVNTSALVPGVFYYTPSVIYLARTKNTYYSYIAGAKGDPGEKGDPAFTLEIINGNWWLDGVDTGISAEGKKGDPGEKGDPGDVSNINVMSKDGSIVGENINGIVYLPILLMDNEPVNPEPGTLYLIKETNAN